MHLFAGTRQPIPTAAINVNSATELAQAIPRTGLCAGCGLRACAGKANSPAYCLAAIKPGGRRRKADVTGTDWLVLDIDYGEPPDELEAYERVIVRTHSGGYHVLVKLARTASAAEYEATIAPWLEKGADAAAKDISRALYAPHASAAVAAYEGEALPVAEYEPSPAKAPRKAKAAPGGTTPGAEAWDRDSLARVLAEPEHTNEKAGHLGAMLAQHAWGEDTARAYAAELLTGRHVESAMSAFRRVRDGEIRWNGAARLQALGLRLLGASDIESARPVTLRRNGHDRAMPWWRWGGAVWERATEGEAEAYAHVALPALNALPTTQRNRTRADALRDHQRYAMPPTDTDPYALNCPNGVVDLRTGELRPHTPGDYCTRIAGVSYDETLGTAAVNAVMLDWCGGDEALAAYVWSLMGAAALGLGKKYFAIVTGPTGTGKSCLTGLLTRALGSYVVACAPETWLAGASDSERQEQLSGTIGARVVVSHELPQGARWHTGLVKAFASGGEDEIRVAGKWKVARTVKPIGLIWLTCNDVPTGADTATRARAQVVPLEKQFPPVPRWADENLPYLSRAALVRIVQEAGEVVRRGGPLPPPEKSASVAAETMASPLEQWLATHETQDGTSTLRALWQAWESERPRHAQPDTENQLGKHMKTDDMRAKYPQKKTKNGVVITGLKTKPE